MNSRRCRGGGTWILTTPNNQYNFKKNNRGGRGFANLYNNNKPTCQVCCKHGYLHWHDVIILIRITQHTVRTKSFLSIYSSLNVFANSAWYMDFGANRMSDKWVKRSHSMAQFKFGNILSIQAVSKVQLLGNDQYFRLNKVLHVLNLIQNLINFHKF